MASLPRRSVLFIHPGDDGYGADRVLLDAVDGLRAGGWSVVVLLPDDLPAGWLNGQLRERGVTVRRGPLAPARRRYLTPLRLPGYLLHLARAWRFIRRAAGEVRPSVIHVNTTAVLVAALVGRPHGACLVWHVHEIVVRPRLLAHLFRLAPMAGADRVLAISDAVRRWLEGSPIRRARITRIYNGLADRPAAPPQTQRPLRIAYVGRLNRWKGYDVFVDAVGRIASQFQDARFLIAGSPPVGEEWRSGELQRTLEARGLAERVDVIGYCDDIPALLDTVQVVAVPSTWPEPFGLVILEAIRSGCAVVASNHGAAPEIITNGSSGLLVEPGDAAALADALATLIADAPLRQSMADRGRRDLESRFSAARFKAELEAVYRGLVL